MVLHYRVDRDARVTLLRFDTPPYKTTGSMAASLKRVQSLPPFTAGLPKHKL